MQLQWKEYSLKAFKRIGLKYEIEIDVDAVLEVRDIGQIDPVKYNYDKTKRKLSLLGFQPTGHKIKIGYYSQDI